MLKNTEKLDTEVRKIVEKAYAKPEFIRVILRNFENQPVSQNANPRKRVGFLDKNYPDPH